MLRAVNIGWLQSPSWLLSKRRSMRRLLLVSLRAIVAFTRNPSWRLVLEKVATLQTPQNAEGFRVFHAFLPPNTGGYAWLRPRPKPPWPPEQRPGGSPFDVGPPRPLDLRYLDVPTPEKTDRQQKMGHFMRWYEKEKKKENMEWIKKIPIPPQKLEFQTKERMALPLEIGYASDRLYTEPILPKGWSWDSDFSMHVLGYHPNAAYG